MLPFSLFLNILANLITIGLLGINYYFVYQWYQDSFPFELYTTSIISVVFTFVNFTCWIFTPSILSKYKGDTIIPEKLRQNSELQKLFIEKYPTQNSNVTLIFTHGWSTTAQIWYYFDKALEHKYNLVFWDEPGLGKSKQPKDNDYSLSKYAADLKDIISTVPEDQKIVLVGHSIGGMIIQQLHKDYSNFFEDRVDAIALFNTTYINPLTTALFGDTLINLQNILIKPALYIQAYTWPIWQLNNLFSFSMVHYTWQLIYQDLGVIKAAMNSILPPS
jgi:pimeloyl-ACP methyl ester carboxylesterase